MELRPYQKEAKEAIFEQWDSGVSKTLLVLPTGCGKTVVFAKVTEECVRQGDRVLILGVGGLGLQGIQIAKHFGAEVYATSRQDKKLELAKGFGADVVINTSKCDLKEEINRITDGEQCDVIFDNIGIKNSIDDCLKMLRPGGKIIVVGYSDPEFEANYQQVVIKEKEIIGIRGSSRQNLVEGIKMVEKGIIKPYIYKTYKLEEINEALDQLRHGGSLGRTVVVFD